MFSVKTEEALRCSLRGRSWLQRWRVAQAVGGEQHDPVARHTLPGCRLSGYSRRTLEDVRVAVVGDVALRGRLDCRWPGSEQRLLVARAGDRALAAVLGHVKQIEDEDAATQLWMTLEIREYRLREQVCATLS